MVLYFSSTGNSKYVAEKIADNLNDSILSINDILKTNNKNNIDVNGKLVIVSPTYLSRMPRIIEDWFISQEFNGANGVYFVMTYFNSFGAAKDYNQKLCESKGLKYMGTKYIHMPNNHILSFTPTNIDEAKEIIKESNTVIEGAINDISLNKAFGEKKTNIVDKMMSSLINDVFYKFIIKSNRFAVSDKCVSCGTCVKKCPLNNISLKNGKPVWDYNCTHCGACICYCPKEAIEYGKSTESKFRYQFEKIK